MIVGMSAMEIYENFYVHAKGTGKLEHATEASMALALTLPERAKQIEDASRQMGSAWKGEAAQGAAAGATPLSALQAKTGEDESRTYPLSESQATSFHRTKHAVAKPPPDPGLMDYLSGAVTNPTDPAGGMSSVLEQARRHDAVSKANIHAYDQYHQVSTENSRLPEDTADLPEMTPKIAVSRQGSPGGGPGEVPPEPGGGGSVRYGPGPGGGTLSRPPAPAGGFGGGPTPTAGASASGGVWQQAPTPGGGGGGPTGTTTSGGGPGIDELPPGVGGARGDIGDRLRGKGSRGSGEALAGMPIAGGMAGGGDAVRGGRAYGGSAFPGAHGGAETGRVPGGSGYGTGTPGNGAGKVPEGGVREPGPGGRVGTGAGARAAEHAAVRSGAARPAPPGREPGMLPPRGGRGKGQEDKEHKSPDYLKNPDPEGTFGTDEKTAPPVLGELPDERASRERCERGGTA